MLTRMRQKLEKELQSLEKEYRQELPKEIHRALQMGDLRENAEYKAALERQQFVQARMAQVQSRLRNLLMIDPASLPKDKVALGSTVSLYDAEADKTVVYELVIPEEADLSKGLVSVTSPIGKALLGHKEGDEVKITIPAGTRRAILCGGLAGAMLLAGCAPAHDVESLFRDLQSNDGETRQEANDTVDALVRDGDYKVFLRGIDNQNPIYRAESIVILARMTQPEARRAL